MSMTAAQRRRALERASPFILMAIIVVLFPLALLGVLGLAGVVLVHEVAEVLVILNGIRAAPRAPSAVAAPAAVDIQTTMLFMRKTPEEMAGLQWRMAGADRCHAATGAATE